MAMMSREERKKRGFGRFRNSFKYSMAGLRYAYKNEQSMTIHVTVTALVIVLGFFFKITLIEWMICLFLIGIIMACELLNTAIEAVVDLCTQDYHPLAKVAKDTASAAVFVFSAIAFAVGLLIFVPYVIKIFV